MDFKRDRLTIVSYVLLGFFMLSRSVLVPFIAYRSAEDPLHISLLGAHITVSAIGIMIMGISWGKYSHLFPHRGSIIFFSLLLACGASSLALKSIYATLSASFILGAAGSGLNISLQASLADHHGDKKKIAIGEAAVIAASAEH